MRRIRSKCADILMCVSMSALQIKIADKNNSKTFIVCTINFVLKTTTSVIRMDTYFFTAFIYIKNETDCVSY